MEIKVFKLFRSLEPEWGATYGKKTQYYVSNDVDKVLQKIAEEHGCHLSKEKDYWEYRHYWMCDREEEIFNLEEVGATVVI